MYRCKLFFSMALSGMVLFSSALAQSYGDGTVLTGQDEPVKQARVEISHQDGADSQTVYTDDEGAFSFNNLYTGTSDGGRQESITVAGSPGRMHTAVYPTPGDDDGVARLYGVNGRLVREIPVESQGGVTTARFGESLSPGVYLYRDGEHAAKLVHTRYGPRASQPSPSLKSAASRDMYTFTITPQDGESNVLFDETVSDQNLESGYNTVDLTVVPTGFMHWFSGEGNVSGAQVEFYSDGELVFQTATGGDGTYQTSKEYLDSRSVDFNVTVSAEDYETLDTLITRDWSMGDGSTFDFTLEEDYPEYYENEEVRGIIRREHYPYDGSYNYIDNAKIVFQGINIDYADSTIMDDDPYYQVFGLHIPVNDQGEPIPAQYLETVTPIDTTQSQMFLPYSDTVTITTETFGLDTVYTKEYPQYVYFQGNVSDVLDPDQKISGASVIAYNPESGEEYAQASTDSQGNYTLDDYIPANTTFAFKVGWTSGEDSDYYSNVGLTASTPDQITYDTVMNADFYNTPKQTTPPATPNDPNHGVNYTVDIEILQQMDGDENDLGVDGEYGLGRQVSFHYADLTGGDVQDFKDFIIDGDSLFHGYSTTAPLDDPNRPHQLIDEHFNSDNIPMDYNPITNPQTESIGWNIQYGGNETWAINREFESYLPYTTTAVAGGDINVDLSWSDPAGTLKELYGRANQFGDVTAGDSFMNPDATLTLQDRICYKIIGESDKRVMETISNSNDQTITFPATVGLQEYIDSDKK